MRTTDLPLSVVCCAVPVGERMKEYGIVVVTVT
jgi:hypothetical protein